jgi:hypothetical protein
MISCITFMIVALHCVVIFCWQVKLKAEHATFGHSRSSSAQRKQVQPREDILLFLSLGSKTLEQSWLMLLMLSLY